MEDIREKLELLNIELEDTPQQENTELVNSIDGIKAVQKEIEEIQREKQGKDATITQNVLDMKSSLKDYEWFAYMGYAGRQMEVNAWEAELKSLQVKKLALEKQVSAQVGNYEKAKDYLDEVDLKLLSTPIFIERAKMRVESSYEYYKMTTGKISRMDYETWILGNSKVPIGDDENYVSNIEVQYKNNHLESNENGQSSIRM